VSTFLQYILSGVTVGSVYAAVAVGFNVIYRTTGVLNFAQGEFVMLGGMVAVTLAARLPTGVAVAVAVAAVGLFGAGLEWTFFRRLRRHTPLHMVVITIGLAILIREAARHVWDEKVRSLPFFSGTSVSSLRLFGAALSPQVLWVLGIVGLAVLALHLTFRHTLAGRAMRACAANPDAAQLAGINLGVMRTLSFGFSAALGALAGCAISPLTLTQYDMGADLAIKGFAAAALGGLGDPMAAVAGGLAVGLAEKLSISILPAAYEDATAFAILILVLLVRPHGLLASRSAARSG
jgi:branched-chain amino acid transport system permease protein